MRLIQTGQLTPSGPLEASIHHQVYCGLDNCLTLEVHEALLKQYGQPTHIYDFERQLQGPYLEIMRRGFLIDQSARDHAVRDLEEKIQIRRGRLNALSDAVWNRPINPRSSDQLKDLFYGVMRLPEIWLSQKGQKKLSMNREALEKLQEYLYARPFITLILAIRDFEKQREVLQTQIDPDGRFRTSYNIAGTETGRPSSSENSFGTGGNAQNVAPHLRYVFVADQGYKLGQIDLEQVEARDVGYFCGCLFGDWSFLDACESGDLHTSNARLIWPHLAWTNDLKADRVIANQQFYREFSFRDMAKRGSHLSNYMGTAYTAARHLKVPQYIMEDFQARYARGRPANPSKGIPAIEPAFPCIPKFWRWVAEQLETQGYLVTPFGRKRWFFGRPNDETTLREAIAFLPQSTTADRMNLGMWKVWKGLRQVQLLAQTYDSITFQFPESLESQVIPEALRLIQSIRLQSDCGRTYFVPGEAKVGWNWGYYDPDKNPLGLKTWHSQGKDTRYRPQGLQRRMF